MMETLKDFIKEFEKIKEKGCVKTHRSGNTGVGKTLEDLLGIEENNLDEPDFGIYELKAGRVESNSMLTLFTRAPTLDKEFKLIAKKTYGTVSGNNYMRMKYGYASGKKENDEKILHTTLSTRHSVKINGSGTEFKLSFDTKKFYIEVNDGTIPVYWTRKNLKNAFEKKYRGSFVYARAVAKGKKENEVFQYKDAYEVCGLNFDKFIKFLEAGDICIDLRIGQYHKGAKKGKIHDHGTAFRIKINQHKDLFKKIA